MLAFSAGYPPRFSKINAKIAMNKRKNQNSEKRREAKKRRTAIKRKAQVRSKPSDNIQTQHPHEYVSARKLSEVVLEFAEPLMNASEGIEGEEKAIRMSITLWNVSLLPKQKALKTINPAVDDMANGDQALKSEFHNIFDLMYDRKQNYFSTDNRFIVDYSLENTKDGFYLQVASTPFKT